MPRDDRQLGLLVSIADEIARLRQDVRIIQDGLIRMGAIDSKKPEAVKSANPWRPPELKRLGDIVTIIAQSNPETARALQQQGFDTERDPSVDPMVDPPLDTDQADGRDVTDGRDPVKKDAARNPRDFFSGDTDPNPRDTDFNPRNTANRTDPFPVNTRDDNDGVGGQVKPDTARDSIEA